MAPKRPTIALPPKSGLWRVGRSPHPLRFSDPLDPSLLESRTTGNRFDSPTGDYRVCYFATTLEACFGETLSRFRPDPGLSATGQQPLRRAYSSTVEIGRCSSSATWRPSRTSSRVRRGWVGMEVGMVLIDLRREWGRLS